jgi:hypothetical protein
MNDHEKSDRPVLPAIPLNNPGRPGAEVGEGRGLPEGTRPVKHAPDAVPGQACLVIWIVCARWRG